MSENKGRHEWIKKLKTVEVTENIHLKFINNKRAEKHLTRLHAMLKEMATFQPNPKVGKNVE